MKTLKALSLWQPWASAMASGIKRIETRSWPTNYRGDLVICSAKRPPDRLDWEAYQKYDPELSMPLGFALCIVELYDCVMTDVFHRGTPFVLTEAEWELGNYTPGRWAWITRNCRPLDPIVPVVGRQGLFEVTV